MNKMAIFVEGYTEVVFIDKLIREVAEKNAVLIQRRRIAGGTNCPRTNFQIQAEGPHAGQQHFVVIHDCGGDTAVKSRMTEEYPLLARSGYSQIICIRDVYPDFAHAEIPNLEKGLPLFVRTEPIVVDFILSIMEVEAWFLAEYSHFPTIDAKITVPAIIAACGFDPVNDDMRLRSTPAKDLNDCYAIGGKTYEKWNAQLTTEALDYTHIYVALVEKFPYLKKLCDIIGTFLKA
jgi:hypothetical protein